MRISQKHIITAKIKKQRVFLIQTQKRSMQHAASTTARTAAATGNPKGFFGRIINKLYYEPRKYSRGFATWSTTMRAEEPVKAVAPEMQIDPETGYEIMNPIDYSGHNHILLLQRDWYSETYYMIRGSFTTSPSPFKGKPPVFFSENTLEFQNKYQYLHVYDVPRLLRKADSIGMDFTTMFLPNHSYIDEIIRQHSKTGLDI